MARLLALLLISRLWAPSSSATPGRKPDILWLITDDQKLPPLETLLSNQPPTPSFRTMKPTLLAPLALAAVMMTSCDQQAAPPAAGTELTTEQINTRLETIIGTGIPEGATNVTISQADLSAQVFDCGFICPKEAFDSMIAASSLLSAIEPAGGNSPYHLSTSWNATDPAGVRFVLVKLTSLGDQTVAVDIGTSFIPDVSLER